MTNMEHNQKLLEQRAALQGAASAWKMHIFPDPLQPPMCEQCHELGNKNSILQLHRLIKDKLSYREDFLILLPCSHFLLLMPQNETSKGRIR